MSLEDALAANASEFDLKLKALYDAAKAFYDAIDNARLTEQVVRSTVNPDSLKLVAKNLRVIANRLDQVYGIRENFN